MVTAAGSTIDNYPIQSSPHLATAAGPSVNSIAQLAWFLQCGVKAGHREVPDELTIRDEFDPMASASSLVVSTVPAQRAAAGDEAGGHGLKASGRRKLGVRKDAPVIRPPGRGSLAKALAAGRPGQRASTLARLRSDEVAASGRGPRQSRWKTWVRLHKNWFGSSVPVIPLTVHSLAAVIGQLKEGHYHAAADYVSTAKAVHLRRHEWSTTLARQHTVCLRSALRKNRAGQAVWRSGAGSFHHSGPQARARHLHAIRPSFHHRHWVLLCSSGSGA